MSQKDGHGTRSDYAGFIWPGTAYVKYKPVEDTDVVFKSGTSVTVKTNHHCITVMAEYKNKSLEELRLEDYEEGRSPKGAKPGGSQQKSTHNKPLFNSNRTVSQEYAATSAGYRVAHTIAKHGKLFTDGELIRECMIEAAKEICPEKAHLFENITLSADTVERRISHLREKISSELLEKTRQTEWFSLALEESTDLSDTTHVLLFIRGINTQFEVYEELLDVFSIQGKTTGEDIFKGVDNAIRESGLQWKKLKCINNDVGRNMCEENKGVVALVLKAVENDGGEKPLVVHGIIHKHSLCGKCLDMSEVLKPVISAVNFIRSKLREGVEGDDDSDYEDVDDSDDDGDDHETAAHHRQLVEFIKEIGDTDLPYYTEVSWLICGKVLKRFFDLRTVIKKYLNIKNRPLAELENDTWLWKLSFYTDLTEHMNNLIFELQKENELLSDLYCHIKSFQVYIVLCQIDLKKQCFTNFNTCREFDQQTLVPFPVDYAFEALEALKINLESRSEAIAKESSFFQNPIINKGPTEEHAQILWNIDKRQSYNIVEDFFKKSSLLQFYKSLPDTKYISELRKLARGFISAFGSTSLCEKTISKLKAAKNTYRPELLTDKYLKTILIISTSNIDPQLHKKTCTEHGVLKTINPIYLTKD